VRGQGALASRPAQAIDAKRSEKVNWRNPVMRANLAEAYNRARHEIENRARHEIEYLRVQCPWLGRTVRFR
jgi:hypothetical protein